MAKITELNKTQQAFIDTDRENFLKIKDMIGDEFSINRRACLENYKREDLRTLCLFANVEYSASQFKNVKKSVLVDIALKFEMARTSNAQVKGKSKNYPYHVASNAPKLTKEQRAKRKEEMQEKADKFIQGLKTDRIESVAWRSSNGEYTQMTAKVKDGHKLTIVPLVTGKLRLAYRAGELIHYHYRHIDLVEKQLLEYLDHVMKIESDWQTEKKKRADTAKAEEAKRVQDAFDKKEGNKIPDGIAEAAADHQPAK